MAKITAESREAFTQESAKYKELIKGVFAKEKEIKAELLKDKTDEAAKKLQFADLMLYAVTLYITINNLSVEMLGVKNEENLNEGRKTIYKAIIYLEELVSNIIDATSDDLKEYWEKLEGIPIDKRYYLSRKLGLAIELIMDAYGDNTKWKWSFVELQGRFITVSKNMLNMTEASKDYFDGRAENHDVSVYYMRMLKTRLLKSAEGYRDRYELSTRRADDMRSGIQYLLAYRRLLIILGDANEAEEVKKKAQVWKDKMEADIKKEKQKA